MDKIREKITALSVTSKAAIEEGKIKSFDKRSTEETCFRVYDGEHMGIQYIQGKCNDEDGFSKADDNLSLRRPYRFTPETGSRHRDKTETEYSDKELLDIAREALDYLGRKHPDHKILGEVSLRRETDTMTNSLGLDYSNTDCAVTVSIGFKHKDSKDIRDGWFELSMRTYDFAKFTDMADNYLTNFTNRVELPEELIIQQQYYGYLGKFYDLLNAENIALGTSLFSGRIGEKIFSDDLTVINNVSDEETWFTTFFDGEGVVNPGDTRVFIENGVLLSGFSDKYTADKYGVPHTGNAGFNMSDIPRPGHLDLHIKRSEKTVKELLGGRLTVVPVIASGGGFNEKGDYVTPVQTALLCDGERFLGRLPEFAIKGNIFDMLGKNFIGVGSDDPVFNDKQILMRMELSK